MAYQTTSSSLSKRKASSHHKKFHSVFSFTISVCAILQVLVYKSDGMLMPLNLSIHSGCFDEPIVFLTVSSLAKQTTDGKLEDRLIEINWNYAQPEEGDWVGLFSHSPEDGIGDALEVVNVTMARGYIRTKHRYERTPVDAKADKCLGYWIAYVRRGQIKTTNCLSTYPRWMEQMKDTIGNTPLHSLMIPGTHNSGSWREYEGNLDVFQRYLINQDESVYRQLVHGIRYLDLRVGYYPSSANKFWVNHNFYRIHPLSTILGDVKKFVEETKEIVILDFHRFPVGFTNEERHNMLVEYLESELGKYAVERSVWPNVTPNEIWSMGKSVIISYSNAKVSHQHLFLWPPLPQEWGDKRRLPDLKEFLKLALEKRGKRGQLWAAMAEFTPKPLDIVLRPTKGLRNMAQSVNIPMTYWFHDQEWYPKANIIATDFFLGNDIIQSSIVANYKGKKCSG